jgi:predicted RNA binding protein YcfA (HicA-like mRNA interferase family)
MKLPRDLSGEELARALCRSSDYACVHQVGSHMILQTENPSHHRLAIPAHKKLRVGTLNSTLRAVATHKKTDRETILASL